MHLSPLALSLNYPKLQQLQTLQLNLLLLLMLRSLPKTLKISKWQPHLQLVKHQQKLVSATRLDGQLQLTVTPLLFHQIKSFSNGSHQDGTVQT